MDQAASEVEQKPQQPEDEQNRDNGPKYSYHVLSLRAAASNVIIACLFTPIAGGPTLLFYI
jgi:hypothetical protein